MEAPAASINHSPPTPTGALSSVSLLLTNATFFFAIPELMGLRDNIFFPIRSNQVLDAPIVAENVMCMSDSKINKGYNIVQTI